MIKHYCDACGDEITADSGNKPTGGLGGRVIRSKKFANGCVIHVEVMRAVNHTWNAGDVCATCIRDVVANGGDV